MSTKSKPAERKAQILAEAMRQAATRGYQNIRRESIADALGISCGLVNTYFSTMLLLRRAVVREAVRIGHAGIVAQGLALRDPQAMKASDELKAKAAHSLA